MVCAEIFHLVNLLDKDGWSALYIASQEGRTEVANLLLEKGVIWSVCMHGCLLLE